MKKILSVLLVATMLFAVIACNNGNTDKTDKDGNKEVAADIWEGVEGDELEFALTVAGKTLNVVLNRDGSCYAYTDYGEGNTINGENVNRPELEGALSVHSTNYGTFEVKDNEITATLDAQTYYRFVASGKDGDALKDAYFETNMSEEYREGYYGKGVIMYENKGSNVLVCRPEGDSYVTVSVTTYDENNVKTAVSVVNADGSYTATSFYPDGTVCDISDYDTEDRLVKREQYSESGALEYVENVVREGDVSVMTRTDADGKVLRTEERKHKKYENGGYYAEEKIVENGVMITHSITDERRNENGNVISNYSMLEAIEGNRLIHNVNYTEFQNPKNNYVYSKETVDGVMTYYRCAIEKVTVMEGVEGRQSVTFNDGKYWLSVEYVDATGSLVTKGYDFPANEYVHGDWEKFEYAAG